MILLCSRRYSTGDPPLAGSPLRILGAQKSQKQMATDGQIMGLMGHHQTIYIYICYYSIYLVVGFPRKKCKRSPTQQIFIAQKSFIAGAPFWEELAGRRGVLWAHHRNAAAGVSLQGVALTAWICPRRGHNISTKEILSRLPSSGTSRWTNDN